MSESVVHQWNELWNESMNSWNAEASGALMNLTSLDNFSSSDSSNLTKARFTSSLIRAVGHPKTAQSRGDWSDKIFFPILSLQKKKKVLIFPIRGCLCL